MKVKFLCIQIVQEKTVLTLQKNVPDLNIEKNVL